MNMVEEKIYELVDKWHGEQRYGKHPYLFHLEMVAQKARDLWGWDKDELWVVAMLHDLIEDASDKDLAKSELAEVMLYFQKEFMFTENQCNEMCKAIGYLTKGESITRLEYLNWLTSNEMAVKIKLADSLSNLECSIASGDHRRISRYLETIKIVSEVL